LASQKVILRCTYFFGGLLPSVAQCRLWIAGRGDSTMSAITDRLILSFIKRQYCPYDAHEEFGRGFSAYQAGNFHNPHEADSVSAQAWDRGVEAAMLYERATAA
jgi:hypothetical protein